MAWFTRTDGAGNTISPGSVCVRANRNGHCEYCVFVNKVWGGKSSSGEYGRFLTTNGLTTIKYKNVLFAFDPLNKRTADKGVNELVRLFYEKGKTKKIAIFRNDLFQAGGIETWLFNIATIYGKTHDITIYYDTGDKAQIMRLSRLVRCIKYDGQTISCDVAIWCYDFLGYETTRAQRKIHVIHADYAHKYNFGFNIPFAKTMCEVYASSGIAAKSASKIFGYEIPVLYNPVVPVTEKRPIKLVSATRLSHEKGWWRMQALAKALDDAQIDYVWDVYTPSYKTIEPTSPNMILKKPIMSVINKMKKADFVVQLSDSESFGYSIVETMSIGTNLVVTDLPVLKELGINNENAIVVPLRKKNYKNIVKRIAARSPYVPPKSDWLKILGPPSVIHYNPSLVRNISKGDVLLDDGRWLEPKQVAIIEDYDNNNPALREIKQ